MTFSLGLPRMHREPGEKRDFLPDLVGRAARLGVEVWFESGIGSGLGLTDADYVREAPAMVKVMDHASAFQADVVLVLRCPEVEEMGKLRRGSVLVSMVHFPTRPRRIRKLRELGVTAVSLDSLVDDDGRRLVENTKAVAWNGLEAAFEALERIAPERLAPGGPLLQVTVIGAGHVGKHAVQAAQKYGDRERSEQWTARGVPAVEVVAIGRRLTSDERYMRERLARTDVLVDASQREDASQPLIPNAWLARLPSHGVVCDLVVDPYVPTGVPPTVRSIEGIPKGDLDQWIFLPDDPGWSRTIPAGVPTTHRRAVASCYSWPGIHPDACMRVYGRQLWPLLERLLSARVAPKLEAARDSLDRALARATLHVDG
jgi:alanine dehydrogenase